MRLGMRFFPTRIEKDVVCTCGCPLPECRGVAVSGWSCVVRAFWWRGSARHVVVHSDCVAGCGGVW